MLRSMYSGVSGMRGFQTKLDVIGNNIANVNTVGFKAGRVMFKDILSQTVCRRYASGRRNDGRREREASRSWRRDRFDRYDSYPGQRDDDQRADRRSDRRRRIFRRIAERRRRRGAIPDARGQLHRRRYGQLVNGDGMFVLDPDGAPIVLDPKRLNRSRSRQDGSIIAVNADGTTAAYRHPAGDR